MKRTLGVLVAAVTLLAAGTVSGSAQRLGSVRDADFLNRDYADTACAEEGKTIAVRGGIFERDAEEDRAYFKILKVVYGDLTGDGADEAVVSSICNTGGTGQFSDGFIYAVRDGALVLLASLGVGDRADGGIHDIALEGGLLKVARYGLGEGGGACCPQVVEYSTFRWNGKALVAQGRAESRTYVAGTGADGGPPLRIRFLRGTRGAVLVGSTTVHDAYLLGARKDQRLTIRFDTDDATGELVVSVPGGARLGRISGTGNAAFTLPATGDYALRVTSNASKDSADVTYSADVVIE